LGSLRYFDCRSSRYADSDSGAGYYTVANVQENNPMGSGHRNYRLVALHVCASECLELESGAKNMRDGFVLGDGMAMRMQCGHPNVEPGKWCPWCKSWNKGEQQTIEAGDVGSAEEILNMLKEKNDDERLH